MTQDQKQPFLNVFESNHPLIKHKLTCLRDKNTDKQAFRALVKEITLLLVYESCRELTLTNKAIETPLEKFVAPTLKDPSPVVIPILRAGLGMVDGFLELLPNAKIGHIGAWRDAATFKPHAYYCKLPQNSSANMHFVCDPMLATGGSASYAVSLLKEKGIANIHFVCLLAAPEGLRVLTKAHPTLKIFTAGIDRQLNEHCYILPGLGDAGDRLYGTQ